MTKKQFKSECRDQTFTGWNGHRIKVNAFYFDFKQGTIDKEDFKKYFGGYKYMVYADVKNCKKADLLDWFYRWVIKEENLPPHVLYKYASTDEQRFKLSLSIRT
jgi:hypothetical protein